MTHARRHTGQVHLVSRQLTVVVTLVAGILAVGPTAVIADGNEIPDAPVDARSITAGNYHTCAVLTNGSARCWGYNSGGELGQETVFTLGDQSGEMAALGPVELGSGRTVRALAAGGRHTCALLDNSTVKCWGLGMFGKLGSGNELSLGDGVGEMGDALPAVALGAGRTARAITAGNEHTCALLDNGSVKCWGYGTTGALGQGDGDHRGDGVGEMGDALPAVALGTGRTATAMTAGAFHTCALLDDATVKCWGKGSTGQLGQGRPDDIGDGAGEMGDALPAVSLGLGRTATAISAGSEHTCALLDNGAVKCWGHNMFGQLGRGDNLDIGDEVGEMGDALPSVALGSGRTAVGISAGGSHTCALLDDGSVKCWGSGGNGRLGQGSSATIGVAAGEMGDSLPPIALGSGRKATAVTTGFQHTCVALDNATMKCFGGGEQGQHGLDSTMDRGDDPDEMGDALPAVILPAPVGPSTVRRPDALVALGSGAFVGDGVHNTTGRKQTRAATVKAGQKVRFTVRLQNDGNVRDTLRLRGTGSTKKFTVTYKNGSTNVTQAVTTGTLLWSSVKVGGSRDIVVTITPTRKATKNDSFTASVTVSSVGATSVKDTVKATVTRR